MILITRLCFILWLFELTLQQGADDRCYDRCGKYDPAKPCQCDHLCASANVEDCCSDYTLRCLELSISCPSDINKQVAPEITALEIKWEPPIPKYQVETLVSHITVESTHVPGDAFPVGSTVVHYMATDVDVRTVNCSFTVTIEVDYCIGVTCERNGTCINLENNFTCACPSGWGGQLCHQDIEGPTVVFCPSSIMSNNEPGLNSSAVIWQPPVFTDNSGDGNITMNSSHQLGDTFYLGSTQVRYDSFDKFGNKGSCIFNVVVIDMEPPQVINCTQTPIVVNVKPKRNKAHVYWQTPAFVDNSGFVKIHQTSTPGSVFRIGDHYVLYNGTDNAGHTATCFIVIQVKDLIPPVFTSCPKDIYIPTGTVEDAKSVTWKEPTAMDNDGIAIETLNSTHISGEDFFVWIENVIYSVEDYSGNTAVCRFTVEVYVGCPAINTGLYSFPNTRSGETASSTTSCPVYAKYSGIPMATKVCIGNNEKAQWSDKEIITNCFGDENIDDQLNRLSEIIVDESNVGEVSTLVEGLTSGLQTISADAINSIADVLDNVVAVGSTSTEVTSSVSGSVGNILEADAGKSSKFPASSASKMVTSLETQVGLSLDSEDGVEFTYSSGELAVNAINVDSSAFVNGLTLSTNNKKRKSRGFDHPSDVTITLPSEIGSIVGGNLSLSHIVYQNDKLFVSDDIRYKEKTLHSNVASATVVGVDIKDLREPVVIIFKRPKTDLVTWNITNCVYWKFSLNNGVGDWADDGCELINIFDDGSVECHCNHLTNFAVLMDVHVEEVNEKLDTALEIISIIGCAVSIVCLTLTLITLLYFKRLRAKRHHQILINLSISLIFLYATFIISLFVTDYKWLCSLCAALLHYFVLSSLLWMATEAIGMYYNLIKVFNSHITQFLLKACIICWGLPLIIIAVILGIDRKQYVNDSHCFMISGPGLYFGLLLMIGIILIFNLVVYVLVMKELLCSRMQPAKQNTDKETKTGKTMKRLQNAFAVSVLLGLTWLFGFISMGSASVIFEVLFCVFNSFQGLIIFVFFCLRNQEIRNTWKAKFLYGSDRYLNSTFLSSQRNKHSVKKYDTVITSNSVTTINTGNSQNFRRSSIVELDKVNNIINKSRKENDYVDHEAR